TTSSRGACWFVVVLLRFDCCSSATAIAGLFRSGVHCARALIPPSDKRGHLPFELLGVETMPWLWERRPHGAVPVPRHQHAIAVLGLGCRSLWTSSHR